ncbi:polymorphic toxin-type HINT domain-containing protein [Kitasatospora sp. NPDC003701]
MNSTTVTGCRTFSIESQVPAVRAAATQALKGDAVAIAGFLEGGQYQAAVADLQVSAAKLMDGAGPAVREAGQQALNGGVNGLRDFLVRGRYAAQLSDDQVRAAQLFVTGGPELKAAAQVALEGPPQVVRAFIQTGQYTAARKDQLAATHVAEVQRMIAEAASVTAYAQQSAAEAVQVATVARDAAGEAKAASDQAKAAADSAAGFAADARSKAEQAAASAEKAAAAAKTASNAEASARRDAASAMVSSQKAQRSAEQASWSAEDAYASAARARADAEAAGKDKVVAEQAAGNAFAAYNTKLAAEKEAERKAAEQAANDAAAKAQAEKEDKDAAAGLEAELRKQVKDEDSGWLDTALNITHGLLDVVGGIGGVFLPGIADIADLVNCGIYALQKDVENAVLSCVGAIPLAGDAAAVAKLAKWAEKIPGGKKVIDFLDNLFSKVKGSCPIKNSFPAGTRVLMADGTTVPIEQVQVGQEVLATDPVSARSGARKVTATIRTPDDDDFTDLAVRAGSGSGGSLTATDHHPFWSVDRQRWTDAVDLRVGDVLRSDTGAGLKVVDVRDRKTVQEAFNLTVDDIHTYYVLAGSLPVLVHNCGKLEYDQGVAGAHPKDHLDLSDDALKDRARTDPRTNVASMLNSSTAQKHIDAVVEHYRDAINKWAAKADISEMKEFTLNLGEDVGRAADNTGKVWDAKNLTLVLRRIQKGQGGHKGSWVVYTVKAY